VLLNASALRKKLESEIGRSQTFTSHRDIWDDTYAPSVFHEQVRQAVTQRIREGFISHPIDEWSSG
jgi:hypothetical protein